MLFTEKGTKDSEIKVLSQLCRGISGLLERQSGNNYTEFSAIRNNYTECSAISAPLEEAPMHCENTVEEEPASQ